MNILVVEYSLSYSKVDPHTIQVSPGSDHFVSYANRVFIEGNGIFIKHQYDDISKSDKRKLYIDENRLQDLDLETVIMDAIKKFQRGSKLRNILR
jgi:hypothetical protein